ncbi:hypothetical protein N8482_00615 [Chitinophagales bacterium]|nr:hypothetical protein [Chitinophagales bacterium]
MKQLENEFKNRFEYEQNPMESADVESLWSEINNEISDKPQSGRGKLSLLMLLCLAFIGSGVVGYYSGVFGSDVGSTESSASLNSVIDVLGPIEGDRDRVESRKEIDNKGLTKELSNPIAESFESANETQLTELAAPKEFKKELLNGGSSPIVESDESSSEKQLVDLAMQDEFVSTKKQKNNQQEIGRGAIVDDARNGLIEKEIKDLPFTSESTVAQFGEEKKILEEVENTPMIELVDLAPVIDLTKAAAEHGPGMFTDQESDASLKNVEASETGGAPTVIQGKEDSDFIAKNKSTVMEDVLLAGLNEGEKNKEEPALGFLGERERLFIGKLHSLSAEEILVDKNSTAKPFKLKKRPASNVNSFPKPTDGRASWMLSFGLFQTTNKFSFSTPSSEISVEEKNKSERFSDGRGIQLAVSRLFKSNWFVQTGIEYHQLRTKFDYLNVQTREELRTDYPLLVWMNVSSGDTLQVQYGDATARITTTRKVVHYNRFNQFSVPLLAGISKSHNRFTYGLSMGPVVTLTTKQTGRTLNIENEIVYFSELAEGRAIATFAIGFRANGSLNYAIAENWSLGISPAINYNRYGSFDALEVNTTAWQLQLGLGLTYRFH